MKISHDDLEGNLINEYNSMMEVNKKNSDISDDNLRYHIKKNKGFYKGYIWKYK